MKKSIMLTLNDEELIDVERILLDEDMEGALRFLKKHFDKKVSATLS